MSALLNEQQSQSVINAVRAVTALAEIPSSEANRILYEGWVLKKRRKRMQGFARRYFVLYQSGILAYSVDPDHPSRDQISIPHAAISTAPGRRDIHIDSNAATFHIKCLSGDDFDKWMSALRSFAIGNLRPSPGLTSRFHTLNRSGAVLEEMGTTLTELEDAVATWQLESMPTDVPASPKAKDENADLKEKTKGAKESRSVLGLFRRSTSKNQAPIVDLPEPTPAADTNNSSPETSPQRRVQIALVALKAQHAALVRTLQTPTSVDASTRLGSPLPPTVEENTQSPEEPRRLFTPIRRVSKQTSLSTTLSEPSVNEWFDALDSMGVGAQEYSLEIETPLTEKEEVVIAEEPCRMEQSESDTNSEASVEAALILQSRREATEDGLEFITRRTALPNGPVGDEGGLFAFLKKNVGKDLATVAFPVTFNEPLTLLQRAAEEVEYHDLLRQAVATHDPVERMALVAAFAISGYAHTRFRSGRKGFNPMLGETFEDSRMKFIAEKVQHTPLVIAYHAEGEGWELSSTSCGKTKFWGKSLEIIPLGTTHVRIGDDWFAWKRPSSFMRNLMMGTKYLEHCGKMTIDDMRTRRRCMLDFKLGVFKASNLVSGTIFSPTGEEESSVEGKWDDQMALKLDPSNLRVLWRAAPHPGDAYGFTSFGITLNEITSDLHGKLPPTDSRLRPDVRALEDGNADLAESEKQRLEEMQRARRREGVEPQPQWFKQVGEEWFYAGGYWEKRAQGWEDVQALW